MGWAICPPDTNTQKKKLAEVNGKLRGARTALFFSLFSLRVYGFHLTEASLLSYKGNLAQSSSTIF